MTDGKDRKQHWEHIYHSKPLETVSWHQPVPTTSLELISRLNVPKEAPLIDVGGGDSLLADHLLDLGFTDITVLDISGNALDRARERLGDRASIIQWIEGDATCFTPEPDYALWHDRAVFHFLTEPEQRMAYIHRAVAGIRTGGFLILGTFSDRGPLKCSGLEVQRYSTDELQAQMQPYFKPVTCLNVAHNTPSGSVQDFSFCAFVKV
ncbi:MAG: class I SAM-dependent methyltransferase [Robiginitalea sp.]|uniref:class I SAM-dependent methyltransferase n=1 Tax=Robiginitalea sp. TaxID=1902411 RepID=UPI003C71F213